MNGRDIGPALVGVAVLVLLAGLLMVAGYLLGH